MIYGIRMHIFLYVYSGEGYNMLLLSSKMSMISIRFAKNDQKLETHVPIQLNAENTV